MRFWRNILKNPGCAFQLFVEVGQHAYLMFYVIPRFRIGGIISGPVVVKRGYRCFILLNQESVIKVANKSSSTVDKEFLNFQLLKKKFPNLNSILPTYQRIDYLLISAFKTELLLPLSPYEALPIAVRVQKMFDEITLDRHNLLLHECIQLNAGINYLRNLFGPDVGEKLNGFAIKFLNSGNYRVGLAHGDFHSRNIMAAPDGGERIIDLDCIRLIGIREIDALYFSLEREWSETGQIWANTLIECLRGGGIRVRQCLQSFNVEWSDDLAVILFIDRIGHEYQSYQICYPKILLGQFLSVLESKYNIGIKIKIERCISDG